MNGPRGPSFGRVALALSLSPATPSHHHCFSLTLSPGWTYTGMTNGGQATSKPAGAWTAEQTVEYMFEKVLIEGDFYVICPDNQTTSVSR